MQALTSNPPLASVIIPARNEEQSLGRCLRSLQAQAGIDFELIVIDDDSCDGTAEIARSFAAVKVIAAGPLPENWTGKTHAMAVGARLARGKWLLFTDADTVHRPMSLARSVEEAERQGAALLSYSPQQQVHGFWQRAVMPVIFAELARAYPPQKVSDPMSPVAAANGQYLLVWREVYEAVGGHRAVANDLLEDVALARRVKSRAKIVFRYGGDRVCTRMYSGFNDMKDGWTKNLALLFPNARRLALGRVVEFLIIFGGFVAAGGVLRSRPLLAVALWAVASTAWGWFWLRIRRAHFSALSNLVAVFGLLPFALFLVSSRRAHDRNRVTWKGRRYGRDAPRRETNPPRELGNAQWLG
jgi:glycosyltransferase involved in cell wall biosynthesis